MILLPTPHRKRILAVSVPVTNQNLIVCFAVRQRKNGFTAWLRLIGKREPITPAQRQRIYAIAIPVANEGIIGGQAPVEFDIRLSTPRIIEVVHVGRGIEGIVTAGNGRPNLIKLWVDTGWTHSA